MILSLGSYTDAAHPHGLQLLEVNETTGAATILSRYSLPNATYQAYSSQRQLLVSTSATGLAAFRVEQTQLAPLDSLELGGQTCHVSLAPDAQRAYWADYFGGRTGEVALTPQGRFGAQRTWCHQGSGPNLPRQERPHCHQTVPAPEGSGFYVVDLGLDQIVRYPDRRVFTTTPPGAGPRHLLFHPNGTLAFLVYELGNLLASLRAQPDGSFEVLDLQPTTPPETPPGLSLAAALRLTPDAQRIVVSNRGDNSLVAFAFDPATGRLHDPVRTPFPPDCDWPRDFLFLSHTLAVAALERSGHLLFLRYSPDTGRFSPLATLDGLYRPAALNRLDMSLSSTQAQQHVTRTFS